MTRKTIILLAAVAVLGGVALLRPTGPGTSASSHPVAAASLFELHRNAHLDSLPVQEFEDLTFVYPPTTSGAPKR